MKKYITPEIEIEMFKLKSSVMTISDGLENGDTNIPIEGEF